MPRNIVKINDQEYMTNSGYKSISAYFGNLRKGNAEIYDTPFAKGESTQAMLKAWLQELSVISEQWPTLMEFEKDLAKKVGPLSVQLPLRERMPDVDHYYEDILLPSKPLHPKALLAAGSEWKAVPSLSVREMAKTVKLMKKSTNSGLPFFTKKRNVVDLTIPCDVRPFKNNQVLINQAGVRWRTSAVLGWRGQEGGIEPDDVKQRVIWMFPFSVNIRELQVYQPLIEAAQKYLIVPAWVSMEEVDRRVTQLFDTKGEDDLVVCTDFERFDQHFNSTLQDTARQLLRGILRVNQSSLDWLTEVFPIKYMIPLMWETGSIRTGRHGMASGSGGTNADETLAHRALQYECAILSGARLNPNSQCLGDDGILTYPGITVEDVIRNYSSHGLTMNESKQYVSKQDCVYLRRWHHKNYRIDGVCAGVYSTCRALGRMRYMERYMDPDIWSKEMVNLRYLSILENVKNHPLREQFVEFCMKRDRYRLGIDIPGFLEHIEDWAEKAIDYMPDFMGYTKTLQSGGDPTGGIGSWWITKYLLSKA